MSNNDQTLDLFNQSIPRTTTLGPETHDTCEISFLYMQRPRAMVALSLSVWFANAHGLTDSEFTQCASALEAKRMIVKKGYNRFPLEPLVRYNAFLF